MIYATTRALWRVPLSRSWSNLGAVYILETQKELAELLRSAISAAVESIANRPERIAYTIDDAALATGLTRRKIEGAIDRGELRCKLVGRTILISAENLRKWATS